MTLSIRARLTLWYSTVVVLVLVTGAVVGSLAQSRLAFRHLDDGLARTMATLEGVMRTEFGEGLTLEAAAEEASIEVVAPDRVLALTRPDGSLLAAWGVAVDRTSILSVPATPAFATIPTPGGDARFLSRSIDTGAHRYRALVGAPLEALREQHAQNVRALAVGVLIALLAAAAGGWFIGRQTLRPLTQMAEQAGRIDHRAATERLSAPNADDELGLLARSFNDLLDRLAEALRHQRQFMADASHELRTPVSVVRTATEVTLSRARTAEEYRESLVIVSEQANRLSKLVEAMFLLSRAEAQGMPLRLEFLNLDDLVAESARALRVLADQRGVAVATEGAQEVGFTGDEALLRQMIVNLLDNAIRHARPGGAVVAALHRAPGRLTVRVTDDGPGIEAADRQRIFERFVRIGASDGAGLGLPIARWVAEAHGGTLSLEHSEPGRTTFVAILPADDVINRSSTA
jgi:two-component system, OmpR family, sensor kinase